MTEDGYELDSREALTGEAVGEIASIDRGWIPERMTKGIKISLVVGEIASIDRGWILYY